MKPPPPIQALGPEEMTVLLYSIKQQEIWC